MSERDKFKHHLSPPLPLSQDPLFLPPTVSGTEAWRMAGAQFLTATLCSVFLSSHVPLIWCASCPGCRAFSKQPPAAVCSLHRLLGVWASAPGAPITASCLGCGACRAAPQLSPQPVCHVLPFLEQSFTPSTAERPGRMLRRGRWSRPSVSSPQSLQSRWCYLCLWKVYLLHHVAFFFFPKYF